MQQNNQKKIWSEHYKTAPKQLKKMSEIKGLVSAFNTNIDAVKKVSGSEIENIIKQLNIDENSLITENKEEITTFLDVLRGFIKCFSKGIAEEWVVNNQETFEQINKHIGYDKMQMGGQGGIVANLMGVCNIDPVYVHCASLPKEQAELFHNLPNLKSFTYEGEEEQTTNITRSEDIPLIHFIIEFDKGDSIKIKGKKYTCPKANRFIATYDPLNLKLHIDKHFDNAMLSGKFKFEHIILSGFQLLKETLPDGKSGIERTENALKQIKLWQKAAGEHLLHFEVASTQDKVIRKKLIETIGNEADSIGINERELIDILEVIGENSLAEVCDKETTSTNLFKGMLKVLYYIKAPRIQLHMFGLYITLQQKGFKLLPLQNRNGMQLAAVIAATKAATGSVSEKEILLYAKDKKVSDKSLEELNTLAKYITDKFGANNISETGIYENNEFDLIAVPSIIIDKPVTLVGMGDTISSVSIAAAR